MKMLSGSGKEWEMIAKECREIDENLFEKKSNIFSIAFIVFIFFSAVGFQSFAAFLGLSLFVILPNIL